MATSTMGVKSLSQGGDVIIRGDVHAGGYGVIHEQLSAVDHSSEHKDDMIMHDCSDLAADQSNQQRSSEDLNRGGDAVNNEECMHDIVDDVRDSRNANLEPHEGLIFQTYEEALLFYKSYGKREGFVVTKRSTRRSMRDGKLIDGKFVCSRYGKKQEKLNVKYPRPSTRIECKAAMHVKKRESDGKWYTYHFMKEHNHELIEDDSLISQSHNRNKNKIPTREIGIQTDSDCPIISGVSRGSHLLVSLTGNSENVVEEVQRLPLREGELDSLHEFFMHMQEENPNFFYALDLNGDQCLKNIFWVDAKGRYDYISFRDVVLFDMTYLTETYKMPFAPFIGVNHHGQPILLGCALLLDKTTSTLAWLMKMWLRAMGGKAPEVIITGDEKALRIAIKELMPDSQHCFCLWYIIHKISKKFCYIIQKQPNFMDKFEKCIHSSWKCEDFERRWRKFVTRFDLSKDEWLQFLYEERRQWVPTCMTRTFLAGLSTSLRSESVASLFDNYISKETTLKEFLQQYKVALQDRCAKESLADFYTWHTRPELKSTSPYEIQMSSIYTRKIFNDFQVEVIGAQACSAAIESEDETAVVYKVNDFEKNLDFLVAWKETESVIFCSCRLFEIRGLLCRHKILVLQLLGACKIPSCFILQRWTKDAKSISTSVLISSKFESRMQRYNYLCCQALALTQEGLISQESQNFTLSVLEGGRRKCADMNNCSRVTGTASASSSKGVLKRVLSRSMHKATRQRKANSRKIEEKKRQVNVDTSNVDESLHGMNHLEMGTPMFFGNQGVLHGMDQGASRTPGTVIMELTNKRMQNLVQHC